MRERRPRGDRALRAARHRGRLRRCDHRRVAARRRRRVPAVHLALPLAEVLARAGRAAGHGRARVGPARDHDVARRARNPRDADLRRCDGRRDLDDEGDRARVPRVGRHGQLPRAGCRDPPPCAEPAQLRADARQRRHHRGGLAELPRHATARIRRADRGLALHRRGRERDGRGVPRRRRDRRRVVALPRGTGRLPRPPRLEPAVDARRGSTTWSPTPSSAPGPDPPLRSGTGASDERSHGVNEHVQPRRSSASGISSGRGGSTSGRSGSSPGTTWHRPTSRRTGCSA